MRQCYKTRNFAGLNGLIEEAQNMGNRMEEGLGSKKDCETWRLRAKEEKKKYKAIMAEINKKRKQQGKDAEHVQEWP
jgi:hypothetical protein